MRTPVDTSVLQGVQRPLEELAEGRCGSAWSLSGANPTDWKSRSGAFCRSPAADGSRPRRPRDRRRRGARGRGHRGRQPRHWMTLAADGRPASGTAQPYTIVPAGRVSSRSRTARTPSWGRASGVRGADRRPPPCLPRRRVLAPPPDGGADGGDPEHRPAALSAHRRGRTAPTREVTRGFTGATQPDTRDICS